MTRTKQNLADAQELVRSILAKNFNQKIKATDLRAAAAKVLEAVPSIPPKPTKQAA